MSLTENGLPESFRKIMYGFHKTHKMGKNICPNTYRELVERKKSDRAVWKAVLEDCKLIGKACIVIDTTNKKKMYKISRDDSAQTMIGKDNLYINCHHYFNTIMEQCIDNMHIITDEILYELCEEVIGKHSNIILNNLAPAEMNNIYHKYGTFFASDAYARLD